MEGLGRFASSAICASTAMGLHHPPCRGRIFGHQPRRTDEPGAFKNEDAGLDDVERQATVATLTVRSEFAQGEGYGP